MYVCIYIYIYTCICVHVIYLSLSLYIYIYVHTCVYIRVHIYIYIYTLLEEHSRLFFCQGLGAKQHLRCAPPVCSGAGQASSAVCYNSNSTINSNSNNT